MSHKVNPLEKFLQGFAQVKQDKQCPIQESKEDAEVEEVWQDIIENYDDVMKNLADSEAGKN